MKAFDKERQVPSAAADLQDPLVRLDAGLIDQLSVDRPHAQQSLERVVKR
jgi:hypothetical protein